MHQQDQRSLVKELQSCSAKKNEVQTFQDNFGKFKERPLGAKRLKAEAREAAKAAKGKQSRQMPVWKSSADDCTQAQAKSLLQPGASIWRANFAGSWQVHLPPHGRHSESWSKYGNSSHQAMVPAVKIA